MQLVQRDAQAQTHIGLIYPLSTNGSHARERTNSFSLHAIAGLSAAETGFSLAGISLVVMDSASGLQCSGFSNHINNKARGVQLAGFLNSVGSSNGLSMAGFANICRDSASGAQLAGFINKSRNAGVQVAGFINKAADVHTQAAGFINIAKRVRGIQLAGFINIADSCDYPIALLNFIRNGERSIGISTDETLTGLVSFRSGGRKLYSILGVGYNNKDHDSLFAWQVGLGMHIRVTERFRVNMEGVTTGLTDFKREDYFRATLRVLPALHFARRVELFAGPSFNYVRSDRGMGATLVTRYSWKERVASGLFHGLYFGATGGINFIL